MIKITVEDHFVKERIDAYMALVLPEYSRGVIQKWIEDEKVLVNGNKVKNNYRLKEDDEIAYEITEADTSIKPVEMDLDVVYEDEDIMVVNKPKGMIVHPSPSTLNQVTLAHGLLAYTKDLSDLNGDLRPGIVHRLDKDTSGLLMIAKTNKAHEILVEDLKDRKIDREYMALVHHPFTHQSALIDAPIGRDPKNRQRMAVTDRNSKVARTHVELVENYKEYALFKCKLDTGRTHQIRVHCSYIDHPIVGDQTYSYKNTPQTEGQCLHAYRIAFDHPITKERMSFTSEMPEVMKAMIEVAKSESI